MNEICYKKTSQLQLKKKYSKEIKLMSVSITFLVFAVS